MPGSFRARAAGSFAAGTMHRDVHVSREGRMPVGTASVEPAARYIRRACSPKPDVALSIVAEFQ